VEFVLCKTAHGACWLNSIGPALWRDSSIQEKACIDAVYLKLASDRYGGAAPLAWPGVVAGAGD
jgi:hypothetical protein